MVNFDNWTRSFLSVVDLGGCGGPSIKNRFLIASMLLIERILSFQKLKTRFLGVTKNLIPSKIFKIWSSYLVRCLVRPFLRIEPNSFLILDFLALQDSDRKSILSVTVEKSTFIVIVLA